MRRFVVMTHARNSGVRVAPSLTREERRSLALHAAIAQKLAAHPVETLARAAATLSRMRNANPGAAGGVLGANELLIIGSQALHGSVIDDVPAEAMRFARPLAVEGRCGSREGH